MQPHTVDGVTLPVPEGWEVSEDVPDTVLAAVEPRREGRFAANTVVTLDVLGDETLVGWAQRQVAMLTERVPRLRVLDLEDVALDGWAARRVLAHYPLRGHGGVTLEQWLVPDGQRGVVLSCSAAALEYDRLADLFVEVAAGLRVSTEAR